MKNSLKKVIEHQLLWLENITVNRKLFQTENDDDDQLNQVILS